MKIAPLAGLTEKLAPAFYRAHPYRIEFGDSGQHIRFASFACAAQSAIQHRLTLIDETNGQELTWRYCVQRLNQQQQKEPKEETRP